MLGRLLIIFILGLSLGCSDSTNEVNTPIFPLEPPGGKPTFELDIDSRINQTVVEPSGFRRFVRAIVGWIPLVGDVFEIPMNIVNSLLPNLRFDELLELPKDVEITDPEVMKQIEFIGLNQFFLNVTPDSERGEDYKRQKCYLVFKCKDQDLAFIKKIVVAMLDTQNDQSWVLAEGDEACLSNKKKRLTLNVNKSLDLRPFLQDTTRYAVSVVVSGRIPKRKLYLEGGVSIKIRINYGR
jgi:hypothetical protein